MDMVLAERDLWLLWPARHSSDPARRLCVRALIRRVVRAMRAARAA